MTPEKMFGPAVAGAALLILATVGGGARDGTATVPRAQQVSATRPVTVVAAGDIACAPGGAASASGCQQAATARLARSFRPRYVVPLGDEQYDDGDLADYRSAYARTWGRLKAISRPVPGNHDYHGRGAAGYFAYFRQVTSPPGYYAFDVNGWRIYGLNSNCSDVDCGAEAAWLNQDLTAHPRTCTAIAMHHPRYSSGAQHGDTLAVRPLWQVAVNHRVDLALAGHDHEYERFRAMDATGHVTRNGLVSFVVGTGGKSLYRKGSTHAGSVVFDSRHFGVLALRLGRHGFAWQFKTIGGRVVDAGVRGCH
jgi:calcineurin-like phosphoesterase family protein